MKHLVAVLFVALSLASTSVWAVKAGDKAPQWTGIDTAGEAYTFPAADPGKTTVLVFWATWCPYCQAFMPNLAAIERDYAARGVQVVAVNAKERGAGDPREYMEKNGYGFRTIVEGDGIAASYDVKFIPGLMIVDASGTVIWRRKSTNMKPGKSVADFWEGQVRAALEKSL